MKPPASLRSAANCLIAVGFFYLLTTFLILQLTDRPPDDFGKSLLGFLSTLGIILWLAAFLLYRCNKIGKGIWWICCPLVLLQFPVGTILGIFVFIYLDKPDAKAALAGRAAPTPPPIPLH